MGKTIVRTGVVVRHDRVPFLGCHSRCEHTKKRLGGARRRCRILAAHYPAIEDGEGLPIGNFLEIRSQPLHLVFNEKRHDVRQLNLLLLLIREAGDALSFHEGRAVVGDMPQHARRVAHQSDRFTGAVERFQQGDRDGTFREIPHRTVPADVEHGVIVGRSHVRQRNRVCQRLLRFFITFEPRHRGGLVLREITLRIDRRLPSSRRRERELNAGVPKHEVRRCKLLQPKPSLAAGLAESIVRREYHHNFHVPLLVTDSNDACDPIRPDHQAGNNWTIVLSVLSYRAANASVTGRGGVSYWINVWPPRIPPPPRYQSAPLWTKLTAGCIP